MKYCNPNIEFKFSLELQRNKLEDLCIFGLESHPVGVPKNWAKRPEEFGGPLAYLKSIGFEQDDLCRLRWGSKGNWGSQEIPWLRVPSPRGPQHFSHDACPKVPFWWSQRNLIGCWCGGEHSLHKMGGAFCGVSFFENHGENYSVEVQ